MKITIEIPEKYINDAERVAILSGMNDKELFDKIRSADAPIDITDSMWNAYSNQNEKSQFMIGLIYMALAAIE